MDYMLVDHDSETGYILDVDLAYPDDLHETHNDYPLAPESLKVTAEFNSPYMVELLGKLKRKPCRPTMKLVLNLGTKRNYVVHYRNLQFYVRHGLAVINIRRVLKFTQDLGWLRT